MFLYINSGNEKQMFSMREILLLVLFIPFMCQAQQIKTQRQVRRTRFVECQRPV